MQSNSNHRKIFSDLSLKAHVLSFSINKIKTLQPLGDIECKTLFLDFFSTSTVELFYYAPVSIDLAKDQIHNSSKQILRGLND